MKNILLVYLPFCTPASPPYSLTNLYSFLKSNTKSNIEVLDLNLEFHKEKFPKFKEYYSNIKKWDNYDLISDDFRKKTVRTYSENNKKVVNGENPELFNQFLEMIKEKKPDIVAFSIVYSSQAFYAYALLKELKSRGIKCVLGGPAVNEKITPLAGAVFANELDFFEYITGDIADHNKLNLTYSLDFSIWDLKDYFTPYPVIPLKTTSTCYYKGCTFCTHFKNVPYMEYELESIKNTIIESKQKHFFLIDDMIPVKMLLKIAEAVKPLGIYWACQLRPTQDFDETLLKTLKESGLVLIMWGVESGNDRVLNMINKGTNIHDIEIVLKNSHNIGIKNIPYMMIGFPTETKEEFIETINFLNKNEKYVDLVSFSVFGLQKDTSIYKNPHKFGIKKIIESERTVLEPRIDYELDESLGGLSQEDANKLRDRYKRTIEKLNKYPKTMNFFREHMFCMID